MLDSRPLMSVTPFYVAFKRPISTESKVYVRVHHTDGRMCYPQCLIPGSNPPVYQSCSGATRMTNQLPTVYYVLTSMAVLIFNLIMIKDINRLIRIAVPP
jgi:hypothetical protein